MTGAVEVKQSSGLHSKLCLKFHAAWNVLFEIVSGRWISRWADSLGETEDEIEELEKAEEGSLRFVDERNAFGWIWKFDKRKSSDEMDAPEAAEWEQGKIWKQTGEDGNTRQELNQRAEQLLDHYGNHILRLAYSYLHNMEDAEEILQETLLKCLQEDTVFENTAHEKAWLLKVASNLSKNRIRYNQIRETDELDEQLAAEERRDLSFVWEAVKSLPDTYREAIHLFYYEGYPTAQIASILGRKESTIRSDLRRGRERLKEILKEVYDFEKI